MPTRGSRLVGLLSMIMTSVLGSGLRAHEVATRGKYAASKIAAEICVLRLRSG